MTDLCPTTLALECATKVVDDHAGAPRGKEERVLLSEPAASSGHHHHLAVEA